LHEFSEKLDNYIGSIDVIELETYVNKVSLYKTIIERADLRKSGDLEYSYKINWQDIFDNDGSVRQLYIRLVRNEQKKN
jgi:hypothetical protein